MIITMGLVATFLFLNGLISQIVRIHRRKMADDISQSTILQWLVGFVLLTSISLQTKIHWIFPFGYVIQGIATLYLYFLVFHYQREMNLRMWAMRGKINSEVRKNVIQGGKK